MVFSYTQISQYLGCPRRYRYRYLDGWHETQTRAAMSFGRAFEKALAAYFCGQDSTVVLFEEWGAYREKSLDNAKGDTWDKMLQQGIQLLHLFAQDDRIRIQDTQNGLQVRLERPISNGNNFVAYGDAIGSFDQTPCLIEWKTTSARYADQPEGILALDP